MLICCKVFEVVINLTSFIVGIMISLTESAVGWNVIRLIARWRCVVFTTADAAWVVTAVGSGITVILTIFTFYQFAALMRFFHFYFDVEDRGDVKNCFGHFCLLPNLRRKGGGVVFLCVFAKRSQLVILWDWSFPKRILYYHRSMKGGDCGLQLWKVFYFQVEMYKAAHCFVYSGSE